MQKRSVAAVSLFFLVALIGATPVSGQDRTVQAQVIRQQLARRGAHPGEISLHLAWHHAEQRQQQQALHHLRAAQRQGIALARTELALGYLFRRMGRYDAAYSTLVRLLVKHPEHPYALIQLWKTLYEAQLQGAQVKTDERSIQRKLDGLGFYFPAAFDGKDLSESRSRKLAASGYSALLNDRAPYAAELFEAAITAFPSNPLAHRGLGIARARAHDLERAVGAYLLYLELKPNAPDADEVEQLLVKHWRARR